MSEGVYTLLRKRYPANAYALMAEVRDKAGFEATRSADYIIVGLWPSRGLNIEGIELKSHRSDWLSELKRPEKAESFFQFCDHWWLLTAKPEVAKLEEIPPTWGWMEIVGNRIVVRKEAPKNEYRAITRHFMCALVKRAVDRSAFVHRDEIKDEIEAAVQGNLSGDSYRLKHAEGRLAELDKFDAAFRATYGVNLQEFRWSHEKGAERLGKLIKEIEFNRVEHTLKSLTNLEKTARQILEGIEVAVKNLTPLVEEPKVNGTDQGS